ncbi:tRNA lysidine(34) synthetase TilS [Kineococcus gynurae]|uniref:tRNA(Ile)-lysidine synthase n=1 Tax=Kineococcus gynurae TaxID=452979 RepID=A0ABV5LTZ9_9ACTN
MDRAPAAGSAAVPARDRLEVRRAVRAALADLPPDALVLVACSGGADSLALAFALAEERPGSGAVVVDHGLRPDSAAVAARAVAACRAVGLDPVVSPRVAVGRPGGPEGAARDARYAALAAAAAALDARAVLTGHTRDDQAESVLLGLARGSGPRSLAGMPARRPLPGCAAELRRPVLALPRELVRSSLGAGPGGPVEVDEDPTNADPATARARVRHTVLPVLEAELGPGVAAALARTARAARDDADALDALAAATDPWAWSAGELCAPVATLLEAPAALRRRHLRRGALAAGSPAQDLTAGHVDALDGLLLRWRGQGPLHLPGPAGHRVEARREAGGAYGRLRLAPVRTDRGGPPVGPVSA